MTTQEWRAVLRGVIVLSLFGVFSLVSDLTNLKIFAQDATLISASNDLHPTEVFSVVHKAETLQEAFDAVGIDYFPEDKISYFPDPGLGLGTVITVQRALAVTIVDGKKTSVYRTWQDNVGDFFKEKRIDIGDEDRFAPSLSTPLGASTKITITRVARSEKSEFEVISFQVVEKDDPTTWRGERKTVQEGVNGKREKRFLFIREDGELVSKTLLSNTVVEAAKNKIISVGTKLKIGQTLTGKATWYRNSYGTKVAMDAFRRGVEVRITNLSNGKSIIVKNDGCICGATGVLVDLSPEYFQQLGGTLGQGVMTNIRVEEILN